MSETVTCPQCDRPLRVPDDLLGKRVKCPSCAQTFTAGGEGRVSPAPDDRSPTEAIRSRPPHVRDEEDVTIEDDISPGRPGGRYDDEFPPGEERYDRGRGVPGGTGDWARVRTGIMLVLFFMLALVLVFVISMVAGMALAAKNMAAARPGMAPGVQVVQSQAVTVTMGFLYAASMILALIGYWFCTAAPARYRAKGLAKTAFVLGIAGVVLSVTGYTIMAVEPPPVINPANPAMALQNTRPSGYINFVGTLLDICAFVVFLFFLGSAARALGAKGLAGSTKALAIVGLVLVAGYLVMMGLAVALVLTMPPGFAAGAPPAGGMPAFGGLAIAVGLCGCVDFVLGLAVFVWSIISIVQLRTVLNDHLVG